MPRRFGGWPALRLKPRMPAHATAVVGQLLALGRMKEVVLIARDGTTAEVRAAVVDLLEDPKSLGSISRHAQDGATRLRALGRMTNPEEVLNVAMKSEHTDAAVAALERVSDPEALGTIAQRARNKVAARRARTRMRLMEDAARPAPPQDTAVRMKAEDRSRALAILHRAEGLVAVSDPDAATTALAETRLAWAEFQADVDEIEPELTQQFEAASDAVREAIAERQRERAAEQERANALAREQADRVIICQQIESLSGPEAVDRIAELKVQWDSLAPMPSEYAASLNRRFQDACRAFEDRERRRLLAQAAVARLETLATELEQLVASDQPLEEIVARWRGLRRDADVLREHAAANPGAAERLERAVALLEEKEHQQQQVRAKQEQDNLKRLQQVCRQVETLAAAEQITLKAGDRALRDIRSALDERMPLPSKKDRQEIQARLEAARAQLGPRVQELRDADEWQRWANLQVQEELCREMEALKAEENLESASRRMRELQGRWKQVALAPRAQGEAMWRRFKSAQDEVFARTSAHMAAQNEERHANLARKQALSERARGARGVDRLGAHGHGDPEAAGRVEDDRPGHARSREGGVGAIPRRVRSVLHAPAGRSEAPQGRLVGQPRTQGSALRARRGARRFDRVGLRGGAAQTAAGRVEDDRTGAQVEVRGGVAAVPDRVRSLLRSLQASRSGGPAGQGGAARERSSASSRRLLPSPQARAPATPGRPMARPRPLRREPREHDSRRAGALAAGARAAASDPAGLCRALSPGAGPSRGHVAGGVCRHRSRSGDHAEADGEAARASRGARDVAAESAGAAVANRAARAAVA